MASIVRSSNTAARCIFATRSTANFHLSSRNTFSVSYLLSVPSQWRQYSTEQDHNLKDKLDRKLQIYTSTSDDPYLNLSIEHYLMEKSDPESTVLFLYQNRPCVVFGRNQNPWLEVNLSRLGEGLVSLAEADTSSRTSIDLVRRRSGGGTVYHDEGNINWSIICPPAVFDRDRHAEMVVRALHRLGVKSAQVNDRHDIVIHGEEPEKGPGNIFKVSGSAYKLTRKRALHHGTCLLSSHNLPHISALLRSFAEPFIKARGVESVRSKIRNVHVPKDRFIEEVVREFQTMYVHETEKLEVEEIGRDSLVAKVEAVQKGMAELKVGLAPKSTPIVFRIRQATISGYANTVVKSNKVTGLDLPPNSPVHLLHPSHRRRSKASSRSERVF